MINEATPGAAYKRMLERGRMRRAEKRLQVFAKTNGHCFYCLDRLGDVWHVDHVFPRSRGGSSRLENLVPACVDCNLDKSDRTPEEWKK